MNIVVPLMGTGERFKAAGYAMPKPMISVAGKPMIERAIEPFLGHGEFTFVVRREYEGLKLPGRKIVLDEDTEGAACTVLAAREYIDNSEPLIILNSDQIVDFSWLNFHTMREWTNAHGIIWVFKATGNRWSYVRLAGSDNFVTEVVEKRQISDWATCGVYWFKRGWDFCYAAHKMITDDVRINGEFYVAPTYNWLPDNSKILPFESGMHGLGTPEDLKEYLCSIG